MEPSGRTKTTWRAVSDLVRDCYSRSAASPRAPAALAHAAWPTSSPPPRLDSMFPETREYHCHPPARARDQQAKKTMPHATCPGQRQCSHRESEAILCNVMPTNSWFPALSITRKRGAEDCCHVCSLPGHIVPAAEILTTATPHVHRPRLELTSRLAHVRRLGPPVQDSRRLLSQAVRPRLQTDAAVPQRRLTEGACPVLVALYVASTTTASGRRAASAAEILRDSSRPPYHQTIAAVSSQIYAARATSKLLS